MGARSKYLKIIRFGLGGTLVFTGGAFAWMATDRLVEGLFNRFRPQLEKEFSKPLGHPLKIGPYKGLRPWGIAIGSSRLNAGLNDDSTATFAGLHFKFAPIASLFNLRPVAVIRPKGTIVNLRPNENGSYWVLGPTDDKPPNINLSIQLDEPAKIYVDPANIHLTAIARTSLALVEKKISGSVQVGLPNKGSFFLKGQGYWDRLELRTRARFNQVTIEPFQKAFLKAGDFQAAGILDGDIQLSLRDDQLNCRGALSMADFKLKGRKLEYPFLSRNTSIRCNKSQIQLEESNWDYGPWRASFAGNLPLNKDQKTNLGIETTLRLKEVNNSQLDIKAKLPLNFEGGSLNYGELVADLDLKPFPLSPIGSLIGTPMAGTISASGAISGPFNALTTNLSLGVVNPQVSGLRLQEEWRGEFLGDSGGGGNLQMASVGAAVPGSLTARFKKSWALDDLTLKRLGGEISLEAKPDKFYWQASDFRLDRVEVSIPPETSFNRIFGQLSGQGEFSLAPFSINGDITMRYPRLLGLRLKEAQISGNYFDNDFKINGKLSPSDTGRVNLDLEGRLGGALKARADAKGISARWLASTASQLPKLNLKRPPKVSGTAKDLGGFFIKSFGGSLDSRLSALAQSQASYIRGKRLNSEEKSFNPNDIQGKVDAIVEVKGPDMASLGLNLQLTGRLWPTGRKDQIDFEEKPIYVSIKGPLQGGMGEFSLLNVPFTLLYLVTPIPSSLTGGFGLAGTYRLRKNTPEVTAELVLNNARLDEEEILLDKGHVNFANSLLEMNVAIRSASSTEPLIVKGQIPVVDSLPIDLRIESHGDGIKFLDALSDGIVSWNSGTADLRFLIRGTLNKPEANGFLVMKQVELLVMDKVVNNFESSMVFDFNRLELQRLDANIGSNGTISGLGSIALFRIGEEELNPLTIQMNNVPVKLTVADVVVESSLEVKGAVLKPMIGGDLTIKKGSISSSKKINSPRSTPSSSLDSGLRASENKNNLPEQQWDMKEPLILFVQDTDATASRILKTSTPSRLSSIGFDKLKLRLGPDLRITSPPNVFTRQPLVIFDAEGLLTLNGNLDQSLNASGVVRLIKGRVNLFTTTFTLDRSEPNVAVFTPSMGLIPYVDVTMTSRVADTVSDANNVVNNEFTSNGSGAFGIGGSRFVKVEAIATGPADRLSENFQLRSTPPMPKNQLLGLIGGNSLTSLLGGGESGVWADVISRSLISPLLGNVTDTFSDRLQVSLYPAYVSPEAPSESGDRDSTNPDSNSDLSPQQAWVTEVGIDLNKKFNFSVQATPNRDDIPPQGTLTFQLNSNLGVLGSLDKNGKWQSQLQMFFRY